MTIITDIAELPKRIKGEGYRADDYTAYLGLTKFVFLNDDEFNKVIDHNTKRLYGPETAMLAISNGEDIGAFLIFRKSDFINLNLKPADKKCCGRCNGHDDECGPDNYI